MNLLFYHEQSNNQKLKTQKLNKDHFSGLRQFLIFFRENVWDWSIFKVVYRYFLQNYWKNQLPGALDTSMCNTNFNLMSS